MGTDCAVGKRTTTFERTVRRPRPDLTPAGSQRVRPASSSARTAVSSSTGFRLTSSRASSRTWCSCRKGPRYRVRRRTGRPHAHRIRWRDAWVAPRSGPRCSRASRRPLAEGPVPLRRPHRGRRRGRTPRNYRPHRNDSRRPLHVGRPGGGNRQNRASGGEHLR